MADIDALLLGDDVFPWHDLTELGPAIEAAIGDAADVVATTDRQRLLDLDEFDVLVDYTTDSTLADAERDALCTFVAAGGGYLGFHCAADLTSTHDGDGGIEARDEPVPELRGLLGGHFLDHPEQSTVGVDVVAAHPVTRGVSDFEVFDEPYRLDVDAEAVTILARLVHPDDSLEGCPVVWIRAYGDGRVCYSSVGHTARAFEHDEHRRLARNAVRWVARCTS